MNNARPDMTYNGSGVIPAGTYGTLTVRGSGNITGPVDCMDLLCAGALKASHPVVCRREINCAGAAAFNAGVDTPLLHCAGSLKVTGPVFGGDVHGKGSVNIDGAFTGQKLIGHGSLKVSGPVQATELRCAGSCKIGNAVQAQTVKFSASATVEGDVSADTFEAEASVHIRGLLSAEQITLKLTTGSDSQIGNIGGSHIHVLRSDRWGLSTLFHMGSLYVTAVEGDVIALENTYANIVRGDHVTIGSGCHIDRVEYSGTLTVAPDAQVGEQVQTD